MAVQISRSFHSEVPTKGAFWGGAEDLGNGVSAVGRTQRVSGRRGAHHARSRPHAHKHPAEAGGIKRGGVYQRQECDPRGPAFFEKGEELRRPEFMGARVLRGHSRPRYGGYPAVYPKPRG